MKGNELRLPEISVERGSVMWDTTGLKDAVVRRMADFTEPANITDESYKGAKATRAELNKMLTAIDTERKSIKSQLLEPVKLWESEVKEVFSPIVEKEKRFADAIHAYEAENNINQRTKADPIVKGLKEEAEGAKGKGAELCEVSILTVLPNAVAVRLVGALRLCGWDCSAKAKPIEEGARTL